MAYSKKITKQRHQDVRQLFAKMSREGKYKYPHIIKTVAEKCRYMPSTVERIVCTQDEIVEDNSLKLF